MNPLGTRARVDELARQLDGPLGSAGSVGSLGSASSSVGPLVGRSSKAAAQVDVVVRLRSVGPALDTRALPRPDFRDALRSRLVAVAAVQPSTLADTPTGPAKALDAAVTWTQTRKAQRRIGATAGAMASVIAVTGIGIAASRSLPGAPFYSLKTTAEDVQLSFVHGDTAKGSKHLELAAVRLREVAALAHGEQELSLGAPGGGPVASGYALSSDTQRHINETLDHFDDETKTGRALLEHAYRATGKVEPLHILKSFSSDQQTALVAILPELPSASKRSAESSLDLVTEVSSTVNQLLSVGTCGGSCFPQPTGPASPNQPVPTPGATASPSVGADGTTGCACVQPQATPEPTDTASPAPAPAPSDGPTDGPAPTGSASPSPSSPSPAPAPSSSPSTPPAPAPSPSSSQTPDGPSIPLPVVPGLPLPLPTAVPLPTSLPPLPALPVVGPLLPALPKR